jgi:ATP-dependent exoDNAse (exonuclease V) alpha subunit
VQTERSVQELTKQSKLLANSCYKVVGILKTIFGENPPGRTHRNNNNQRECIDLTNDDDNMIDITQEDEKLSSNTAAVQSSSQYHHIRPNVFITGPGGAGKSFAIRKVINVATKLGRKFQVTATTGQASTLLPDAVTLHSFSGLGKGTITMEQLIDLYKNDKTSRFRKWKDLDLLIIDEVSMLGARFLAKVNYAAQIGRNNFNDLFGGIQIVAVGDFLQLPAIGDQMAFTSPIWEQLSFKTFYLTLIHRQKGDTSFQHLCNRLRMGEQTEADIQMLESHVIDSRNFVFQTLKPVQLFSDHISVDKINIEEFNKLDSPIVQIIDAQDGIYERVMNGTRATFLQRTNPSVAEARRIMGKYINYRLPERLEIKNGAQYILTVNVDLSKGQTNGRRCLVQNDNELLFSKQDTGLRTDTILKMDKTLLTRQFRIFGAANQMYIRRTQYALRLGYACTIHSSQGMTLDEVAIDLGRNIRFNAQAYVALTRCRTLAGIKLLAFERKSLKTHAGAKAQYLQWSAEEE